MELNNHEDVLYWTSYTAFMNQEMNDFHKFCKLFTDPSKFDQDLDTVKKFTQ